MRHRVLTSLLAAAWVALAGAQQVPDTAFAPALGRPAFPPGTGPVVLLDEAHFNFHTATGRYRPFAELLRRDGYVVRASSQAFTPEALASGRVLVVANAVHERNRTDWAAPNPSAFTPAEVADVRAWISAGGRLLLIADHAPFAAAAGELGRAVGVRFLDGYVRGTEHRGPLVFGRSDGTLADHPITEGIDAVATFTGSSFQLDAPGEPLLRFGPGMYSFARGDQTSQLPVTGHLQGAVLTLGEGRVAVFGEAAMFSAQLSGTARAPMGMNAPVAKQNPRFLLNVMRWLTAAGPRAPAD